MELAFQKEHNIIVDFPEDFTRTSAEGVLVVPSELERFMLSDSPEWRIPGNAIVVLNDVTHEGTLYIGTNGRWFLITIYGTCPMGGSGGSLPRYLLVDAPLYPVTYKDRPSNLTLEKWLDFGVDVEIVEGDYDPQNPPVGEPSRFKRTVLDCLPKPKKVNRFDDLIE